MKDRIIILCFMLLITVMIGEHLFAFGDKFMEIIMMPLLLMLIIVDVILVGSMIVKLWNEEFKDK